jgi:YD repeat-containing protein
VPCPILTSWTDAGGEALEIRYSLYDALISINVPADKARAVVDAMERDMLSKLATKTDLQLLRAEFERDMARQTITLLLGSGSITVACTGILFALLKLT